MLKYIPVSHFLIFLIIFSASITWIVKYEPNYILFVIFYLIITWEVVYTCLYKTKELTLKKQYKIILDKHNGFSCLGRIVKKFSYCFFDVSDASEGLIRKIKNGFLNNYPNAKIVNIQVVDKDKSINEADKIDCVIIEQEDSLCSATIYMVIQIIKTESTTSIKYHQMISHGESEIKRFWLTMFAPITIMYIVYAYFFNPTSLWAIQKSNMYYSLYNDGIDLINSLTSYNTTILSSIKGYLDSHNINSIDFKNIDAAPFQNFDPDVMKSGNIMARYKWVLIAGGLFIGARLLKAVPRQYEDLAGIGAFLLLFIAVPLLMRKARASAESTAAEYQVSAQEIASNSSGEYSLYLRSFKSDGTRPGDSVLRRHLFDAYGMPEQQYEVSMVSKLNFIAPVIAIGRPSSNETTQIGAARYYVPDDEDWQDEVRDFVVEAKLIVVRIDVITPGLKWELAAIKNERSFNNTVIILSTAFNRADVYQKLLTFLSSDLREVLPIDVGAIQAFYVDSKGACYVLEKRFGVFCSVEEWVTDQIVKIAREDFNNTPSERSNEYLYSMAGVRCWHREGIGMTLQNSYAGKVLISNEKLLFLSSGSSLIGNIIQQGSPIASENLTHGLNLQAAEAEGSIQIDSRSLLSVDVIDSLSQSHHVRLKYQSKDGEEWCSLAFDGKGRNTVDNLTEMAKYLRS